MHKTVLDYRDFRLLYVKSSKSGAKAQNICKYSVFNHCNANLGLKYLD
jgi:hypothetical protein